LVAPRAVAKARAALPPGTPSGESGCRNNRKICFPGETSYSIWGTWPGLRLRTGYEEPARAALVARRGHCATPFRTARRWARKLGSCCRTMRSACNVRFLVRWRQGS